jgi:hypothetical protein
VQARYDIAVAMQILDHAHLAFQGKAEPQWEPDLDAAPKGRSECR